MFAYDVVMNVIFLVTKLVSIHTIHKGSRGTFFQYGLVNFANQSVD